MNNDVTGKRYSNDIIDLVVARMEGLPENVAVSIGGAEGQESLKVKDLINHIKAQDGIGKRMIDIQLAYIRSFKAPPNHVVSGN